MTTIVWILAGVTAWCVAALALALLIGPVARKHPAQQRRWQSDAQAATAVRTSTWDAVRTVTASIPVVRPMRDREPQLQ